MCVCMRAHMHTYEPWCALRGHRHQILWTEITGHCKLPNMGTRNQIQLCKGSIRSLWLYISATPKVSFLSVVEILHKEEGRKTMMPIWQSRLWRDWVRGQPSAYSMSGKVFLSRRQWSWALLGKRETHKGLHQGFLGTQGEVRVLYPGWPMWWACGDSWESSRGWGLRGRRAVFPKDRDKRINLSSWVYYPHPHPSECLSCTVN